MVKSNVIIKFISIMILMTTNSQAFCQKGNPLLENWNTPFGTPPFSKIENEHYKPAIRAAIKEAEKRIDAIVNQREEPTFENTILAMETASELLDRVTGVLFTINECHTNPEMQKIVMEVSPELTRYSNSVSMNDKLFARIKELYDKRNSLNLGVEQMTLLEKYYKSFERNGVNLGKEEKKQFARNSERLSQLSQQFNQNVLADNNEFFLHITDEKDLSGLPETAIAAAREEAQSRNLDGWVVTLAYPSYGPFMSYADNRSLREKLWKAYNSRGNRGNENDNNEIIREMTDLRYQQARLLGYRDYCDYVLSDRMAQSSENLKEFMQKLMTASLPMARADVLSVQRYAAKLGLELPLQRWDFSYYSEKLKREIYDFDAEILRPYFQLSKVRQGIFDLYRKLYGLTFVENNSVEKYHPEVSVYEVYDGSKFMGILYMDMHPRASKRSGAWMTSFREQSNVNGNQVRPLIQVVCNFSKPIGDQPALLSYDEVETFMHEFGHAMHGMLSECTYASVSGTSVKRDFVELPSQVMENWCSEPLFLNTFAKHYKTGDTIPSEFIKKIKDSENYLSGYMCVRQLSLGLADIGFHSIQEPITGRIEDFERKHMVEVLPPVDGCNTSTAFTHIFAGGYASGYYGYKWAEVLDADVFNVFKQNGIFDQKTAQRFRNEILSKGGTLHPSILFRNFMGRDPDVESLMRRSGFLVDHLEKSDSMRKRVK